VLDYLHGKLPVATAELLAHGEYENGWRYVLMSQLPGTDLAVAWPAIPGPDRTGTGWSVKPASCSPGCTAWTRDHCGGVLGPADWNGFLFGTA